MRRDREAEARLIESAQRLQRKGMTLTEIAKALRVSRERIIKLLEPKW